MIAGTRTRFETRTVDLPGGGIAVVVRDARAQIAEWRVRWRASGWALSNPVRAQLILDHLVDGVVASSGLGELGGKLNLALDGEWVDATGHVDAAVPTAWTTAISGIVCSPAAAPQTGRPPDPGHFAVADIALRTVILGPADRPEHPASFTDLVASGPTVAVVGRYDPDAMAALLVLRWPDATGGVEVPSVPVFDSTPDVLRVPYPVPGMLSITVSSIEVGGARSTVDPAGYVALTAFGSYHGSRLVRTIAQRGSAGYEAFSGRDTFLGMPRTYVRALTVTPDIHAVVDMVGNELRCLTTRSLTSDEIERARRFAAAQLSSMTDSPECLADVMFMSVAAGSTPSEVLALPDSVAGTDDDDIRCAAVQLALGETIATTVVGTIRS